MKRLLVTAAVAVCFTTGLMAQITLPAAAAGVEAGGQNNFPFGYTGTFYPGLRIQTIYDSSNLTSQSVTGPILITGVRWRVNGNAAPAGGTFSGVTISMASAAVDFSAATTNYVGNCNPDFTTVYSGNVTVTPVPATIPGGWFVAVTFASPFYYDPSTGNDLVLETDALTGNFSGAGTAGHDASGSLASRVYGSSAYPNANGVDFNSNPVIEIQYAVVAGAITLPAAATANEGSGGNYYPFGYTGTAHPGLRIQTIYDSSNLTSQGVAGPISITGVRWRVNGGSAPAGGTFSGVTVSMGSAAVDFSAATTNYAGNCNPDFTTVYTGTVTVTPVAASTPGGWFVDVTFAAPFCYDPTLGNDLVLETNALTGNFSGAGTSPHDTNGTLARRVYGSSSYPNANGVDGSCPVIEIRYGTGSSGTLLTTPPNFVSNNSGSVGGCVYFQLDVLPTNGISIDTIDLNTLIAASTPIRGKVYLHNIQADWTQLTGANNGFIFWNAIGLLAGTSNGVDVPTQMTIQNSTNSIDLPPGQYLLAIGGGDFDNAYTNGNGTNQLACNSHLVFRAGKAANMPFDTFLFNPRVANLTIDYSLPSSLVSLSPSIDAMYQTVGVGCGGTPHHVRENFNMVNPFDLATTDLNVTSGGIAPGPQTTIVPAVSADLELFDDSSTPFIPLGFSLALGNDVYNEISICSNGYIRLDANSPPNDYTPSDAQFFNEGARLCPYWDDLQPGTGGGGGTVHLDITPGQAVVTYNGIFLFNTVTPVTFQVVITPAGVKFRYDRASPWPTYPNLALVGYANGLAEPIQPQVNLTAGPTGPFTGPGNLQLLCTQAPGIGISFDMVLLNNPSVGAVLAQFGPANTNTPLTPPFGAGCTQHVASTAVSLGITLGSPTPFSMSIPNGTFWLGLTFGCQGFSLGNGSTYLSSNGITARTGPF